MGLFNPRVLRDALGRPGPIPDGHRDIVSRWAESIRDGSIQRQNESHVEGDFKSRIVETVLGYASFGADEPQTVKAKQLMGAGEADLALGFFGEETRIIAPFELKGALTRDLDAPMPGRRITPVQQAWIYANAVSGVRWVLVSNLTEIRLYAYGEGNQNHEQIDLRRIDEPEEYAKLVFLLSAKNLLGGATADLLKKSKDAEKEISEKLYGDYKTLRGALIEAVNAATGNANPVKAITTAQKILDRVLFVAFAEDTYLLPRKLLEKTCKFRNPYDPRPAWHNFRALFRAIDEGSELLDIKRYNGGLFRRDPAIDDLELPDAVCDGCMALGAYDFASEVSVTVLGHIFEQSVSDLEKLTAAARGEISEDAKKTGTTGRRKREGIVYTPDYIARFIVEKTLGAHVEALFRETMAMHAKSGDPADYETLRFNARKGTAAWDKAERAAWAAYQARLNELRVVDPACGSGVFLVAAFDFLKAEYERVNKKVRELSGETDLLSAPKDLDSEILSRNLYGVDVNEESVEITRLSLWLKTAKRGKVLDSLDATIRVGDSLIEDSSFAYRKHGFEWRTAFPEVFAHAPPLPSGERPLPRPRAGGAGEGAIDSGDAHGQPPRPSSSLRSDAGRQSALCADGVDQGAKTSFGGALRSRFRQGRPLLLFLRAGPASVEARRTAGIHFVFDVLQDRLGRAAAQIFVARSGDRNRDGLRRPPGVCGRDDLPRDSHDAAGEGARGSCDPVFEGEAASWTRRRPFSLSPIAGRGAGSGR